MSILARDKLYERLKSENPDEQIFIPGSFKVERIRGASYELRVAPDYLILPTGKHFWPDAPDIVDRATFAEFTLAPGEVAFVSSAEKLSMPWDLSAHIAPKFRLALKGLLTMGGLLVDPGYGRLKEVGGEWVPRPEGERLHFQLANLGVETIKIVPEETSVAAIQFIELEGDSRKRSPGDPEQLPMSELDVPNSERLLRDFFHPYATEPLAQLTFFTETTKLKKRVSDLEDLAAANKAMLKASEMLLVFGLFLLLITIIGVALAAVLKG